MEISKKILIVTATLGILVIMAFAVTVVVTVANNVPESLPLLVVFIVFVSSATGFLFGYGVRG